MKIGKMVLGGLIIFCAIFKIVSNPISAIGGIIIGLCFFPQIWEFISAKIQRPISLKEKFLAVIIVLILSGFISGFSKDNVVNSVPKETTVTTKSEKVQISSEEKQKAQKELDDLLALSKKANLVTSYEFSDTARIVYVSDVWYTQTAQFKKDFLAKIAMLRTTISGYHTFEVRNAYSNEKVAEVTAFSGSLEVYK